MRENLSARGSLDDWIDASEEALWNAGFERVEVDEHFDRLAADIGENGYLDINFLIQNDGRVRLEIDASDKALIDQFKSSVARVMQGGGNGESRSGRRDSRAGRSRYADEGEAEADDGNSGSRGNKGKRGKKGRSGGRGLRMPGGRRSGDPFYARTWFILLMLVLVPPLGIFLMYCYKKFGLIPRILLTLIAVLYTLLIWLGLFGINTGINQETINSWLQNGQSQITRLINNQKNSSPSPSATPSATPSTNSDSSTTTSPGNGTDSGSDAGGGSNFIKDAINSILPSPTADGESE